MKELNIKDVLKNPSEYNGKEIVLKGWLFKFREQSKFGFLLLRDISGVVQCFVDDSEIIKQLSTTPSESVIYVTGIGKEEKQAPDGFELHLKSIEVISTPSAELPFQVYERKGDEEPNLALRLDNRWLDLRKPKNALIFKVWSTMEKYMRQYWYEHNFIDIKTSKLISIPSEGGAEVFKVNYFGQEMFLTQSPQFYKQMAMASGFEKVFEIGPIFRAEQSFTGRHATEFTGVDMEVSFVDKIEELLDLEEEWIVYWMTGLKEEMGEEIKAMFGREIVIPERPFPRITFADAMDILKKDYEDIGTEDEKALGEYIKEKYNHEFVFITEWPWSKRPFYHMKVEGKELSDSFDLLWNGLETTTGARREHRYDVVVKQAQEKGLDVKNFETFLQFFKYGCPPHGGMGVGPTRLLMKLLNLDNIRDVTLLPRDPKRITP